MHFGFETYAVIQDAMLHDGTLSCKLIEEGSSILREYGYAAAGSGWDGVLLSSLKALEEAEIVGNGSGFLKNLCHSSPLASAWSIIVMVNMLP